MHFDLGKLFSIQDDWKAALQEFQAAVRIDPSYMEAFDALGFAQEAVGDEPAPSQATSEPSPSMTLPMAPSSPHTSI